MSESFYSPAEHLRRRDIPLSPNLISRNNEKLIGDNAVTLDELRGLSPVDIPHEPEAQALLFLSRLFAPEDSINVVNQFKLTNRDGREKCMPRGAGITRSVSLWQDHIAQNGIPQSEAGAWVRMNPVGSGTGQGGTVTDRDIQRYRHVLLECDDMHLDKQASLIANIALPVVAVTESGARSLHALVRVDMPDPDQFAELTDELCKRLRILGFDTTNRNCSRLTRLPGAMRSADVSMPAMQRLVYLNPNATRHPIAAK